MVTPNGAAQWPRGCGTALAGVFLLVVIFVVGIFVQNAQEADWAARSGSSPVEVTGEMVTDQVLVRYAELHSDAEHELTTLRLYVDRTPDSYQRNPPVTVTFDDLRCQYFSSRLWSSGGRNDLELQCDTYITKDQLENVGVGTVEFPR